MTASQGNSSQETSFYLITSKSDSCEAIKINTLEATDDSNGWTVLAGDDSHCQQLNSIVKLQLADWIDLMGKESAVAQNLKQPITCWDKLRPDGVKQTYSPVKTVDFLYLIVKTDAEKKSELEPYAFLRMGFRSLFLERDGQLVKHDSTLCALDFYSRIQRNGFGLLLFTSALKEHSTEARNIAYDRPTNAMVSFLRKHFGLQDPVVQHNRFVIFGGFFDLYTK